MAYDAKKTMEDFNAEISKGYDKLYSSSVINRYGTTTDTGESYTELYAREILKNIEELKKDGSIREVVREDPLKYKQPHDDTEINEDSNQKEANMAKSFKGRKIDDLGTIIDYQTPLYKEETNKLGKIDLLSFKAPNTVYMIEYKWVEAKDTLLRCILEIYTYRRTLGEKGATKLLKDFDIADANLKPAVLVYESCQAYKDFIDGKCPSVIALMRELKVDFFVLNDTHDKIIEPPYMS